MDITEKTLCWTWPSLEFGQWFRKLASFYKVSSTKLPKYLLQLIPTNNHYHSYILMKHLNIPSYHCRTDTFKNSFFPNVTNRWNKLEKKIKGATSFSLEMGCPHANSTYRIHNSIGTRLLTCLYLGLSHLSQHKFRHNTADCINILSSCSIKPETTLLLFFQHCHNY